MSTIFDYEKLFQLADGHNTDYASAAPFPHIVLEDFVPAQYFEKVLAAFPAPETTNEWRKIHAQSQGQDMQFNKLGLALEQLFDPVIRNLLWEMNSGSFLSFLEQLTGIGNLLPDPSLRGGGLHQVLPGGMLGVHADFTRHPVYQLDRRLNILLYLNKNWQDEYGGHLELWDREISHCVKRIRPNFGRCVIFNTDATSFHGHPEALTCPEGMTRKSIALYYYTNGREDDGVEPTSATDWQVLPSDDKPSRGCPARS